MLSTPPLLPYPLPLLHKSQILNRQDLSYGEAVMDLSHIHLTGLDACLTEGGSAGMDGGIQGGQVAAVMQGQGIAGLSTACDLDGVSENWRAISLGASTTTAAPSDMGEQSSTCRGSATIGELSTSSISISI